MFFTRLLILTIFVVGYFQCFCEYYDSSYKWPTVGVSVLVRNKAHSLPYFFTHLLQLDYPKDRMYIWIHSDYNEDVSDIVIEDFIETYASEYRAVYINSNKTEEYLHIDARRATEWTLERYKHVIQLRENALIFARKMWADYIFMIDADVFLTNTTTLKQLIAKDYIIVAPMLLSDGLYSNFWAGMNEDYYYERTDKYKDILHGEMLGCFEVPMVHSAVLISLRHIKSDELTYDPNKIQNYDGPVDDIIAFALNANNTGTALNICNDYLYGFVSVPLDETEDNRHDAERLLNVKMKAISKAMPLQLTEHLEGHVRFPYQWKLGCSEIYMINLDRRTERRRLMELSFMELGLQVTRFQAFDGIKIDLDDLSQHSITLLPNYEDPYHKRKMKAGEVGCFMSHYAIWKKIIRNRSAITMVLEDDVYFAPFFRHRFNTLMEELKNIDWDFVYLGRKILQSAEEVYVTEHLAKPLYSYWTIGYLLSERGAKKLLAANPLTKMLPVDEFLPIMFDQHPNDTWKSFFPKRNLIAYSAAPLLIHPTYYTGEAGYVSDTEDSTVLNVQEMPIRNEL